MGVRGAVKVSVDDIYRFSQPGCFILLLAAHLKIPLSILGLPYNKLGFQQNLYHSIRWLIAGEDKRVTRVSQSDR